MKHSPRQISKEFSIRVVYSLTRTRRILDYRALWTDPSHVINCSSIKTIPTSYCATPFVQTDLAPTTRSCSMTNIWGQQLMSFLWKRTHKMVAPITSVVSIASSFNFLCKFLSLRWLNLVDLYLLQITLIKLIQQT